MFERKGFQGQRLKRTVLRNRKLSAKHNGKLLKKVRQFAKSFRKWHRFMRKKGRNFAAKTKGLYVFKR